MKLFLTGGTGFFGKAILRHLKIQYHTSAQTLPLRVIVLSRNPKGFIASNPEFAELEWLSFHRGDIVVTSSLPQNEYFTHILHAAADSTDSSRLTNLQRYRQIVEGTKNILDFAVRVGADRFLLTSSGGVYGPQPINLAGIPESYNGMPDPLNPNNVYGAAKRQAEHLCALYQDQYGLETVIARCFAFVGQDLPIDAHFAIGNFIRDALQRYEIIVSGDGTPIRSYLDQRDLARWLLAILKDGHSGKAYNVGSDQAISIASLAHLVRDIVSPEKLVRVLGTPHDANRSGRYIPDISLAREELALGVTIPLNESIKAVAALLTQKVG